MIVGRGALPYFSQSQATNTTFLLAFQEGIKDFQVQAQIGHIANVGGGSLSLGSYYNFTGNTSNWSSIQTITIGDNTQTTTPNPVSFPSATPTESQNPAPIEASTQTGNQPAMDLASLAMAALLWGFVAAFAVFLYKRRIKS